MRTIILLITSLIVFTPVIHAQWNPIAAPVDDFHSVQCSGSLNVMISGSHGIYFSSNAGATWSNVNTTSTAVDSVVYSQTQFGEIGIVPNGNWIVLGTDTVNDRAVVFTINSAVTTCSLTYTGSPGSRLNDITSLLTHTLAVGDNNLILYSGNYGSTWANYYTPPGTDNYRSITFGNAYNIVMLGSNGMLYHKAFSGSWGVYTISPSVNGVRYFSSTLYAFGDTVFTSPYGPPTVLTPNANYTNAPMDARALSQYNNWKCIAGDRGIRKLNSGSWELYANTQQWDLKDVSLASNTVGYAVGEASLVLKTTNTGGPTYPYAAFTTSQGNCAYAPVTVTNTTNSVYDFYWYVNGVLQDSTYNLTFVPSVAGNYQIDLVAINGPYADTVTHPLLILAPPVVTNNVLLSDTLLCHTGVVNFTVSQPVSGITYYLYQFPYVSPIDSITTSTDSVLSSGVVNASTDFIIRAQYAGYPCYSVFPQTYHVTVDKTRAAFHMSLFNAVPGEQVDYYQSAYQANHYFWNFGPAANRLTDTVANPAGIIYNTYGPQSVKLVVWNDNMCYDSITANGANGYDPSVVNANGCWAFKHMANLNIGFNTAIDTDNNGAVVVGGSWNPAGIGAVWSSRGTPARTRGDDEGVYIGKYTKQGVLRWAVFAEAGGCNSCLEIGDVSILPDGDVVACGVSDSGFLFYNNLDSSFIPRGAFVVRLDSLGKMRWISTMRIANNNGYFGMSMDVDSAGNIYIAGSRGPQSFYSSVYGTQAINYSNNQPFIAKLDGNGGLEWSVAWSQNVPLGGEAAFRISDVSVTEDGRLSFIGSVLADPLTMGNVAGPATVLPASAGRCIVMGSYSTSGNLLWAHKVETNLNASTNQDVYQQIAVDSSGNCYFSAGMDNGATFPSTAQPSYQFNTGCSYTIGSYSPGGNLRWVTGMNGSMIDADVFSMDCSKQGQLAVVARFNAISTPTAQFLSMNNTYTSLNINNTSFYLMQYDTLGNLEYVTTEMGLTSTNTEYIYARLAIDDTGLVYLAGEAYVFSSNDNTTIFGSTLNFFQTGTYLAKVNAACLPVNVFVNNPNSSDSVAHTPANDFIGINVFDDQLSVTIQSPTTGQGAIELTDISGRIIFTQSVDLTGQTRSDFTFDLAKYDLSAGVYIVKVNGVNGAQCRKVRIL